MAVERESQYYTDITAALAKMVIKRLWILLVIMVIYNAFITFLYVREKTSYEYQEAEVQVDTGEGDAVVTGIGDVYYGENTD